MIDQALIKINVTQLKFIQMIKLKIAAMFFARLSSRSPLLLLGS